MITVILQLHHVEDKVSIPRLTDPIILNRQIAGPIMLSERRFVSSNELRNESFREQHPRIMEK